MKVGNVRLLTQDITSLLLYFSIPSVISLLANSLYTVIDRIFVGQAVGALAIAAISITFPLAILLMGLIMLFSIGASTLISLNLGKKQQQVAEKVLGNTFLLLILLSLVTTSLGLIFLKPLLTLFGATQETLAPAKEFIQIIIAGSLFQSLSFGLSNLVRAEGNPRMSMIIMLLSTIINILLDVLFIMIFHLGLTGAALATITGQLFSTMLVLYYYFGNKSLLKLSWENLIPDFSLIKQIIAIGIAPCMMQVSTSLVTIVLNRSLTFYGGSLAVGAMGVILSVSSFLIMPIIAISQGSQPIISYNYGAKEIKRVKKTVVVATLMASAIAVCGTALILLFSQILIGFFSTDAQLIAIGTTGIKIYVLMFPLVGFQIIGTAFFQATGKAITAMMLSLSRQVIILIPLILILPRALGLYGIWFAAPISDFTAALLTAFYLWRAFLKLN